MRGQLYSLTDACEWHLGKKNLAKLRSLMLDFPKFMLELPNFIHECFNFYFEIPNISLGISKIKVEFQRLCLKLPRFKSNLNHRMYKQSYVLYMLFV